MAELWVEDMITAALDRDMQRVLQIVRLHPEPADLAIVLTEMARRQGMTIEELHERLQDHLRRFKVRAH